MTLKIRALIDRLLYARRRVSFVINPPRLSVNSNRFDRSVFKRKKEEKKIAEKYAATLREANHFLSFRRKTPKNKG